MSSEEDWIAEKKRIRGEMRRRLRLLSEDDKGAASERIVEKLAGLLPHGVLVGTFAGTKREPDLRNLRDARPDLRWCYPRCGAGGIMTFHEVETLKELKKGAFGLMEPRDRSVVVPPESFVTMLCPGVAFTVSGERLGHGGGFYDRYLADCPRAKKIGVCFKVQLQERIPSHPHDVGMDVVVAE